DRVGEAQVRQASRRKRAGERLPPVQPDRDLEGEPALQAHVAEAELAIEEGVGEVQALAPPATKLEPTALAVAVELEGRAGLERSEHAEQALAHPIPLGDPAGELLLRAAAALRGGLLQVEVGASRLGR